jgi:hypothetical protein
VRNALGERLTELDGDDPVTRAALAKLRQECVAAKEALSFDSDTSISVLLPNVQTDIRITRAEFEPMIRAAIGETIDALRRTLDHAGVRPDELAAVLLVGGSSQIPLVAESVSNALGRPVAVDAHPKHSVALGAALAAAGVGAEEPVATRQPARAATSDGTNGDDDDANAPAVAAATTATAPSSSLSQSSSPTSGARAARPKSLRPRFARRVVIAAVAAVALGAVVAGGFAFASNGKGAGAADRPPAPTTSVAHGHGPECHSASSRCAFITNLQVAGDAYVADYVTAGFDPLIFEAGKQGKPEDHHVHFFFDTTLPQNAGTNGHPPGVWWIWDRPSGHGQLRFDQAKVADRGAARRLCILVADSQHAVEPDSGNCVDLPGAPAPVSGPTSHHHSSNAEHSHNTTTSTTEPSTTTTTQPTTVKTFPSGATVPQDGAQP